MGKQSKRDYREEVESHTGYGSDPSSSDSDTSSGSSNSPSSNSSVNSDDGCNSDREWRQRRHTKRKSSKGRREKKTKRGNSSDDDDEEEEFGDTEERRKRPRHTAEEHSEERRHQGGSRRKRRHHHHHRKHKHKHRRHRRHHSEERSRGSGSGGASERPSEGRRGREAEERRARERLEPERERRTPRESDKREKKEEKRSRDKGRSDARPARSKWDDEDDSLYDSSRQIKAESGQEDDGGEGWDGEYENGGGRKRKHHQQQQQQPQRRRQQQQQENSHRPPQRMKAEVKEEPGARPHRDVSNSTTASQNGRTAWGTGVGGGGGGGGGRGDDPGAGEERQKPNLGVTGKLAEDANTYNGVVIKYSQPPEARKPKRRWRWYIFKGEEELPFLPLHRQSAYLIGRDRKVADIPTDHPSCSKQHAVLQYRLVTYNREDGTKGRTVKPYILDLESANGTFINNRRIEAKRFVELLEKDVVKFGYSSREYILLHEGSKGDEEDVPDTGTDLSPVSLLRS